MFEQVVIFDIMLREILFQSLLGLKLLIGFLYYYLQDKIPQGKEWLYLHSKRPKLKTTTEKGEKYIFKITNA